MIYLFIYRLVYYIIEIHIHIRIGRNVALRIKKETQHCAALSERVSALHYFARIIARKTHEESVKKRHHMNGIQSTWPTDNIESMLLFIHTYVYIYIYIILLFNIFIFIYIYIYIYI